MFLRYSQREKLGGTIGHVANWSFENSKHITTGDGVLLHAIMKTLEMI